MSATRDQSQKIAFIYTNFYELYKKGKKEATESNPELPELNGLKTEIKPDALTQNQRVLKNVNQNESGFINVKEYKPMELIGKKVEAKAAAQNPHLTLDTLKANLESLQSAQDRMKFFLKELEDLLKDES